MNNAGTSTHKRRIIFWTYTNSFGYLYETETYSRHVTSTDLWADGAIDYTNNTITLNSPWTGGTRVAGTKVSNGSAGGTYKYIAGSNFIIPENWTKYEGLISGVDYTGTNQTHKFHPATASVKVGWLLNREVTGGKSWLSNISFNIDFAPQTALDETNANVDKSVKSTDVEYYLSTSTTSLNGGSWQTTAPTWVNGKFMWSRTKIELNDGTISYSPSVNGTCIAGATGATGPQGIQGLQGPQGDQGIQGPTGADGLTSYNHIAYADDVNGGGFSQSPTGKDYVGFYSDHTPTDSNNPADYNWSLIKGAQGDQGIQGPTGANGLPSYFHTAWANNSTGTSGFSTTVSTDKLYIGTYSDFTVADSTNPALYKWVKIKGEQGIPGNDGTDGSYVEYQFAVNTSTTVAPASGWQSNPPNVSTGQYLWMQKRTIASNGTPGTWSIAVRISGEQGATGPQGPQGPAGTPGYIGAYSNEATLYVKGFDTDGILQASVGYIYVGSQRITVNEYSNDLINEGRGYIIFDGTTIKFAQLIANNSGSNWVEFDDTSTGIDGSFYVLGTFNKSGNSISNINIFNPIVKQDYEQQYFMDILANGNLEDVNTWAAASGINTVVEKIAILEAFVNKLFANQIKLMENGVIHSDFFNPDGSLNENSSATKGLFLGANGEAKLWKAILEEVTITGKGLFEGDFKNYLLSAVRGADGVFLDFPTFTYWKTSEAYDNLTSINEIPVADGFIYDDTVQYLSQATAVTGSYNGIAINYAIRCNSFGSRGIYAFTGIKLWYTNGTVVSFGVSWDSISNKRLIVNTPNSFDSNNYLTMSYAGDIIDDLVSYNEGVSIDADGTIILDGVTLYISKITPYSDSFKLIFTNGTEQIFSREAYPVSGSIEIISNPDLLEMASVTPKDTTSDIGKFDKVFRNGFFNSITTNTLNLTGHPINYVSSKGYYTILPNGLIIQFGHTTVSADSKTLFDFPISFTSAGSITATGDWDGDRGWAVCGGYMQNLSAFYLFNVDNSSRSVNWIAIGY